jgi:hypothetical protein
MPQKRNLAATAPLSLFGGLYPGRHPPLTRDRIPDPPYSSAWGEELSIVDLTPWARIELCGGIENLRPESKELQEWFPPIHAGGKLPIPV